MTRIFFLISLLPSVCFALEAGHLDLMSGKITIDRNGRQFNASRGLKLDWQDKLTGREGSSARILLAEQEIIVNGPFSILLSQPKPSEGLSVLELLQGKLRMLVKSAKGSTPTTTRIVLRTPNTVMGVRGTDFFASFEPLLGESEVICFENEIDFVTRDGSSSQRVRAGQWGGFGGRFGQAISLPMSLPPKVLGHFKASLPLKTQSH
ncbi:MAG: FecR domain-containing protein [Bdellovibrionota bacterium]